MAFAGLQKLVWVDTDITIGCKRNLFSYCDVDGGYALTALLRSEQVEIVGVGSTLGNTEVIEVSTGVAQEFIDRFGPRNVSVYRGCTAKLPEALEAVRSSDAVEALADALRRDILTVLCLGSATNISTLLLKYPELAENIAEIVFVAGRPSKQSHFYSGCWKATPFRDLNFEFDPRAVEVILESDVELTLVPFEVCHQIWIRPWDVAQIEKANSVGEYLALHSLSWLTEWELVFGANGFNPFDLVAAGYVMSPEYFTVRRQGVEVVAGPDETGQGKIKPYLICNEDVVSTREVNYCVEVQRECKKFLMELICSHDMGSFVLGMSHVNIVVDDIEEATKYYRRVLGFKQAYGDDGGRMDYSGVEMKAFALEAGFLDGEVVVDVRFLKHPQAEMYLELMTYHSPKGNVTIPPQPKTYDMGGPRHIALEVSNCQEVFDYLKGQDGVTMVNSSSDYHPVKIDGFPITFFYWVDRYGLQWEIEEGRRAGISWGHQSK